MKIRTFPGNPTFFWEKMGEVPDFAGDSQHFSVVEVAVGDDVIEIRGFRLTRLHHGAGLPATLQTLDFLTGNLWTIYG